MNLSSIFILTRSVNSLKFISTFSINIIVKKAKTKILPLLSSTYTKLNILSNRDEKVNKNIDKRKSRIENSIKKSINPNAPGQLRQYTSY